MPQIQTLDAPKIRGTDRPAPGRTPSFSEPLRPGKPGCHPDPLVRPLAATCTSPSTTPCSRVDDDKALALLVLAMRDRDEQALVQLHQRTSARLRVLALRLVRRAELADELLMDTYWQAWRQAGRFDSQRGPVMAWLTTMLRSRALDELRRLSCRPLGQLFEIELDQLACTSLRSDPQQQLAHLQLLQLVELALQRLSATVRQLLSMALFGGMSHHEISRATDLPLGTVKSHIRRGLQRIKLILAGPLGRPVSS